MYGPLGKLALIGLKATKPQLGGMFDLTHRPLQKYTSNTNGETPSEAISYKTKLITSIFCWNSICRESFSNNGLDIGSLSHNSANFSTLSSSPRISQCDYKNQENTDNCQSQYHAAKNQLLRATREATQNSSVD
jgi:hypothetical protein